MITPLHLEILMHYFVYATPFRADSETIRSYIQYWVEVGCLEPTDAGTLSYDVTEKGQAWINKVLSTPMPTQKWVWE